jgi:hypothetical protein
MALARRVRVRMRSKPTGGVHVLEMQSPIQAGRYRHYKGREYIVIGVARHSETQEELVVYRQDYGDRSLWVRPRTMFLENIEVDGRSVPRFAFVGKE